MFITNIELDCIVVMLITINKVRVGLEMTTIWFKLAIRTKLCNYKPNRNFRLQFEPKPFL